MLIFEQMCVIIKTIYDFKEKAMKNLIKIITLIICFSFIVSPLAACEKQSVETNAPAQAQTEGMTEEKKTEAPTTAPTETQAEVITTEEATTVEETEPVETELGEDIVSFIDYTRASSRGLHNLKTGGDMAISFTIPEGQLKSIYLTLTDKNGYNDVSYEINVYAFNGKYDESVATEPLCNQVVTSSMRTVEIAFEDGEMGPGSYLVVASYYEDENTPEDAYCSIIRDIFWNNKTEPEGYKDYVLRSYIDGDVTKKMAFCGGFKIEHNVVKTEPMDEPILEKDPDNTVKVILLSGQSNATGATSVGKLRENLSEEEYQKYADGFDNVQIMYVNGTSSGGLRETNPSNGFVPVKVGQGYSTGTFGPELGLAAYLSETYPDETFYIIKYAIGGTGLQAHFNPFDTTKSVCLDRLIEVVYEGLFELEDMGLDPRIVSFLWMQGESDANTLYNANYYYELEKALIETIRDEFSFYASVRGISFIDAAISNSGFWASWFFVNDIKYRISKESCLNYFIDTNDYGFTVDQDNEDLAHYDSLPMLLLGELFGEKVSEFID